MRTRSSYFNKSYLENILLLSTPLGKYTYEKLVMYQSSQTNCDGVEKILLSIITEGYKEFAAVGGSKPFGSSGAYLDDTMTHSIVICSNQASAIISIWVHVDQNISLVSL